MMNHPAVGSTVEIVLDTSFVHGYLTADAKHRVKPTTTIVGTVVPTPKWMGERVAVINSVTKATNYIDLTRAISVNNQRVEQPQAKQKDLLFVVNSSRGKGQYRVQFVASTQRWSCDCAGFQFRGNCRHVTDCKSG